MSRTRSFLHGIGIRYLNQVLTTLVGLWLTWFLLDRLGQDEYGLWLMALPLLAFLELSDLGVNAVVPREVAYLSGRVQGTDERAAALAGFLARVWRLTFWQLPLVAGVAGLLWFVAGKLEEPVVVPLAAVALFFVATFPFRMYEPALLGLQDLAFVGLVGAAAWLLQTAVTVGLVVADFGFWALVLGWAVNRMTMAAACWVRLRAAYLRGTSPHPADPDFRECRALLARGLWVSAGRLAHVLLSGTDIIILGALLGPAAAVVYACTGKLINLFSQQAYALITTAEPGLSQLRVSASMSRVVRAATVLSQLMLLFTGLIACVVLATNEGFVGWWVGADRYAGAELTGLLLAVMIVRHLTFTMRHLLYCFGYERALALIGLADGAATVGATLFLVPFFGPIGSLVPAGSRHPGAGRSFAGLPSALAVAVLDDGSGDRASESFLDTRRRHRFDSDWNRRVRHLRCHHAAGAVERAELGFCATAPCRAARSVLESRVVAGETEQRSRGLKKSGAK